MNMGERPRFEFHVYSLVGGDWFWMDWDTGTPHGPYTSANEALLSCERENDDFDGNKVLLSAPPPN